MAKGKKSFILYTEWIEIFKGLSNENAGKLIVTIFEYVNDLNPEPQNEIVSVAFNFIKLQLKRDLKQWEQYIEKQIINGKKGGRPPKAKKTQKTQAFKNKPKKAEDVDVDVDVDDNVKSNIKFDLGYISENYKPIFLEWLAYKKERRETYKSERSVKACYNMLVEISNNNSELAKKIVNQSIIKDWSGLFPLKNEYNQQQPYNVTTIKHDAIINPALG